MICATDFFTVEIWTLIGLTRVHVLFVIDLATRTVEIAGIIRQPYGQWMHQIARNLTDCFDGFLTGKRFLIHDRDPLFTRDFDRILFGQGIEALILPAKSPNLNAFAERFVRSIKSECLDQLIIFGENNLRRIIAEYLAHYHQERNHQGLDNRLIRAGPLPQDGDIHCHERLGGLLKYYHRDAA